METGKKVAVVMGAGFTFVLGALAGAAVGALLAPESGQENRRKLAAWLKDKREQGKHEILSRKERLESAIEAGKKAYRSDKEPSVV